MKTGVLKLVCCAGMFAACNAAWAEDVVDGKSTYGLFNCALCHGDDAKSPQKAGTPKIAGLDRAYIADKTGGMVERLAHKDALGTCGEVPNKAQIQAIAEWVSRQAR